VARTDASQSAVSLFKSPPSRSDGGIYLMFAGVAIFLFSLFFALNFSPPRNLQPFINIMGNHPQSRFLIVSNSTTLEEAQVCRLVGFSSFARLRLLSTKGVWITGSARHFLFYRLQRYNNSAENRATLSAKC